MMRWVLIALVITAAVTVAAVRYRVGPVARAYRAHAYARRMDLALPAELVPWLGGRLVRRARGQVLAIGPAIGLTIVYLAWVFHHHETFDVLNLVVCFAILQLALVGQALGDLVAHGHRPRGEPRSAHLCRPHVDDFVTPLELWWARANAAVAIGVAGSWSC